MFVEKSRDSWAFFWTPNFQTETSDKVLMEKMRNAIMQVLIDHVPEEIPIQHDA